MVARTVRDRKAASSSLATPTRQKTRTVCPCLFVSRSGSPITISDAIGKQQSLFRREHFRRQGSRLTSLATPTKKLCECKSTRIFYICVRTLLRKNVRTYIKNGRVSLPSFLNWYERQRNTIVCSTCACANVETDIKTSTLCVPKFVPWNEPLGEVPIKSDIRMLFCACDMCAYVVLLEKRYI